MDRRKAKVAALAVILIVGLGLTLPASAEPGHVLTATPPLGPATAVAAGPAVNAGSAPSAPAVVLQAGSDASLSFMTQNGETLNGVPPQAWDTPHLVLRRNGALTAPAERTLVVQVTGIAVPPEGVTVTLTVETQHRDPNVAGASAQRIPVWIGSRQITNSTGVTQTGVSIVWNIEFSNKVVLGTRAIETPTDYFRWELQVTDTANAPSQVLYASSQDYAFLIENQWIVQLPQVAEAAAGAAPHELIVYYCDMFPYHQSPTDPTTWLRREEITQYVSSQLIPAMVQAFQLETNSWGFPWYPEWTPYRSEAGRELSVALADGAVWFHGKAPGLGGRGNESISINVSHSNVEYSALTDGLMSTFYHELFHNLQRNILQHYGGDTALAAANSDWLFVIEGTADLAPSVAQPGVQFSLSRGLRRYAADAARFIGSEGLSQGDLNQSYTQMIAYDAAPYWRFLYEQCGGMDQGIESPARGLAVIRQVFIALSQEGSANGGASLDPVQAMPDIMDKALAGSSCPFQAHAASLQAFARAIDELRLAGGRCVAPATPTGCGFYDPKGLYPNPPASTISYSGTAATYAMGEQPNPKGIPGSFGIDLVDVALDPSLNGRPLEIDFYGATGAKAQFAVQVLYLMDGKDGTKSRLVAAQSISPAVPTPENPDAHTSLVIPKVNMAQYDRLSLVITRIDAEESLDPSGAYTVVLHEP